MTNEVENTETSEKKVVKPTKRQQNYLLRLADEKGKRIVVDLDSEGRNHVEALVADGYAESQVAVVRTALKEAYTRLIKRNKRRSAT